LVNTWHNGRYLAKVQTGGTDKQIWGARRRNWAAAPDSARRPAAIRSGWLDNQVAGEIYRVQEGAGPGHAGPAKRCGGREMSHPYLHAALVRERQDRLLAEAQAAHLAREARAHRRGQASTAAHGARFRRASGWLPSAWSRLLTSRPDSA
jgi:hypothetical protein